MACVALTSLIATIKLEFLQPNQRVCVDDEKPLKSLFQNLSSLQAFLQKEYDNGGAPIRDLEIKIRDFALKAEDDIEIQLRNILLATHKEHQDKLHQTLQGVAKDAEELLNIINSPGSEVEAAYDENIVSGGSLQCSPELEDIMVGCEYQFTMIKDELLNDCYARRRVYTIFGVPGLGKTTLCKKVYADEGVASYFDIQAWVTIPREYNAQQLLCHLLQSMRPTLNEVDMGSTVLQLKEQLYNHLKCKRYLIVLDDLCSTLVWDDIQQCLPDDSNGSWILLTTRFSHVANYVSTEVGIYSPYFLDQDQSWDLFCHRLSLKQYMAPKFEEIAKRLVEECQGLPLSIVAVADRLSKCNYTLKEWKKIEKEAQSLGILYGDTQHTSKLTDIYNQLPQHLKVCFLYFAVFPKGIEIQTEKLIRLWIAEGFVEPLRNVPLEDIAYTYLQDLIHRRLVRWGHMGLMEKTCNIHNDMHSFCVRETQKEGLLCALNTQQCIGWSLDMLGNSCRWLSLRFHSLDYYVLFSSNIPRSLFFFHGDFKMFISFKHLRILDFSHSSLILKRVSLPLEDLVFLRYLSVPQWFENVGDIVSTNSNLQTLIVSGIDQSKLRAPTLRLPSKILEPRQLRHLELGDTYMVDPPRLVKEHLQTLSCAMPIHFRKEVYYCRFPNIRKLKILYKDVLEPCFTCGNPVIILENIEDLLRLETLTVIAPVGSITLLERLGFPANLKKLRLSGTNFPVKVLRVIGQLPWLAVLKLENAFYGRVWEVAEGGFCELRDLRLEARNLERWVAHASHFPNLMRLVLKRCYCLEEIPPGLAKHPMMLYSIKLERCHPSVVTSAKWIQEERMRNKLFVPEVIVDYENL